MANLDSYDPKEISITFDGHTVTGYMDGTFCNVSRDTDISTDIAGADGQIARAKQNDKRGSIVLTILQDSVTNKVFNKKFLAYEGGTDKAAKTVSVKNSLSNKESYSASQAWILKPATAVYSKGIEGREWTIRCADLTPSYSD